MLSLLFRYILFSVTDVARSDVCSSCDERRKNWPNRSLHKTNNCPHFIKMHRIVCIKNQRILPFLATLVIVFCNGIYLLTVKKLSEDSYLSFSVTNGE